MFAATKSSRILHVMFGPGPWADGYISRWMCTFSQTLRCSLPTRHSRQRIGWQSHLPDGLPAGVGVSSSSHWMHHLYCKIDRPLRLEHGTTCIDLSSMGYDFKLPERMHANTSQALPLPQNLVTGQKTFSVLGRSEIC